MADGIRVRVSTEFCVVCSEEADKFCDLCGNKVCDKHSDIYSLLPHRVRSGYVGTTSSYRVRSGYVGTRVVGITPPLADPVTVQMRLCEDCWALLKVRG